MTDPCSPSSNGSQSNVLGESQGGIRDFRVPMPHSAAHLSPELEANRRYLDQLRVSHLDLYTQIVAARDGELFMLDLFLLPVLQRSYGLVEGFLDAFDRHNPAAAAPLVRLQLDSLFRVRYVAHHEKSDDIARDLWKGKEFRHMQDGKQKRKLTDAYLKGLAAADHPWAAKVYDGTSGWVHFSPSHIKAAWQIEAAGAGSRTIEGGIPYRLETIPVSFWQSMLDSIVQATLDLFEWLRLWARRKGLPSTEMRDLPIAWPIFEAEARLNRLMQFN